MRYITLLILVFLNTTFSYSQWVNLDTGINDNLTGVVFLDENGLASGANGLYYTTTGGVGVGSWTRFEITDSIENSIIYENTVFTHCYSKPINTSNTGFVYACGHNTATNKAIIIKIALPSLAYEIMYIGSANTKLNKIEYSITQSKYIAVGDDGLLLTFTDTTLTTINTGLTDDLLSISASSSTILMGSDQKVFRTSLGGSTIGTVTVVPTNNSNNIDVALPGNSSYTYALGDNVFSHTDLSSLTNFLTRYNQNYYGSLDANGMILYSNNFYIGTDHGIYRCPYSTTNFQNVAVEWQTSSLNYHINDFWKQDGTTDFYAFGNNGVILKTSSNGGATKPYVRINSNGGCYPGSIALNAITGSGTTYNWYSNGNLIQSGTNSFNYNFPSAGEYTISLTVQNNAGEQSTDTKVIHVVNPPQIDKVVTFSDIILCKQEVIQIQIADSEPNVIYTLKIEGQPNSNFGQSQVSTGGTLIFDSSIIDLTGSYYIDAKNSLATCSRRFTGNSLITVEETKADFHSGLINAEVNELVDFYENSVDSQNFEWQFTPNASIATSSLSNPQLSFSAPGQVTSTLHSWSDNNCHDVVVENKPFVFEPASAEEECFSLVNNSNDPIWPGNYNPDISQMTPIEDGFLLSGTYFNEIFDSNHGVTLNLNGKKGGYLSKYDSNGVLKWTVYNINSNSGNNNDNGVISTAVDMNGNIYISGIGKGQFIDNTGRSTNLSEVLYQQTSYYLIKLNSKGELIWYIQNLYFSFEKLAVDNQNNLVALSSYSPSLSTIQLYLNGVFTQEIGQQVVSPQATNLIVKFSPSGSVIWDTKVYLYSANRIGMSNLGIDGDNNIYFTMDFDMQAKVYQAGSNTLSETITGDGSYGSKIGLIKMSPNGEILWKVRSRTIDSNGFPSDLTYANKMIVENDGTIYLTGTNSTGYNSLGTLNFTHVFENTDGSVVATQKGPYFVAKINNEGICQWIRGAGYSYYGYGYNLLKTGNEIFVVGQISNNSGGDNCTALFDSTDGNGYSLTINKYDYFISVYDEAGNLKRLFLNNDGGNVNHFYGFKGFFKGNNNHFYLAKNMGYPSTATQAYNDFGLTLPEFNGIDGTVVRFTESCGITKYSATLSTINWLSDTLENLNLVPNPTSSEFNIVLNNSFESVTLEVYDSTGKMISEEQFDAVNKVSSSIKGQSGLYFVRLKIADNQKWFKLIKL